jgi:hypothetical protein
MTPEAFCNLAMADYERQWAVAAGHQQRHPLRVKMDLLRKLTEQARDADEFGRFLADGCRSDDPIYVLLCAELNPWWERLRAARKPIAAEPDVPSQVG